MNLLIDPLLFKRYIDSGFSGAEQVMLERSLGQLTRIIRDYNASVVFYREEWLAFQHDYVGPVHANASTPSIRTPIGMLRDRVRVLAPDPRDNVHAWGFEQLFRELPTTNVNWSSAMAAAAAQVLRLREPVAVFTPLIEGRNMVRHVVGHSELHEKTRWRVYVRSAGVPGGIGHVPCLSSARNAAIDWTTRFDDALPDTHPSGGYSFQPPSNWHKGDVVAIRTSHSKKCWIDSREQHWADPNTPGSAYHWDVYFQTSAESPIGISPINVVRWGAPASEGTPGAVHHIPASRAGRVV
jgi:hypothetical protein